MQKTKRKIDFTNGKIFLKIIWFVLPIVASNLLQMLYNAADMMVVSLSHEQNAVGAIGTTTSFVHLVVNLFIGFAVGANVVVAREIGAGDGERTQNAVHTSLIMAVIFGVVGCVVGVAISKPVLRAMGNTGNLLSLAVTYTSLYFLGVPFLAVTNYLMAIFRAKGDAKTPLIVLACTGVLNVVMNLFFVLAVGLSVEGVAIATAIANVASAVILLVRLQRSGDETAFSWKKLKVDRDAFWDIVVNGLPAGIQSALFSLSNMLIQSSVVTVNNNICPPETFDYAPIVSGNSASANLEGFVYTAMNAVYQGAITFTSQNIGAKKPQRVKRIMYCCFGITTMIGVFMSGIVLLLHNPLLALYGIVEGEAGSLEALAMDAAITRLWFICAPYFLCGCMEVCTGVLRGLGKSLTSTVISLIGACFLRVVWIWTVFPASQTLETIFLSYPITWIATTLTAFIVIQVLLRKILKKTEESEVMEY
ncbi:MAG: MATE family efflux transporter [Clostridiales bacterium]|nr:MATE family efflux transporter [Clostridiales bacterium]